MLGIVNLGGDDYLALLVNGLCGICDDVQKDLIDLRGRALDLRQLPIELANVSLVLQGVSCNQERLVETGVDIEARDRRPVQTAEVFEALGHLGQLGQAFDAVPGQVPGLLEAGFDLLVSKRELELFERLDETRLILIAIRKVLGSQREDTAAASDELFHEIQSLLNQYRVIGQVKERGIDFMADTGDQLPQ